MKIRWITVLIYLVLLLNIKEKVFADEFWAGANKVDITPQKSLYLAGGGLNRKSENIRGKIWCRSLSLRDTEETIIIASLDLIGFFYTDAEEVRFRIKSVPKENILIVSTHNHSGPDTLGFYGKSLGKGKITKEIAISSGRDKEYLIFLKNKTADCLNGALKNLQPANLLFSKSEQWKISRNSREPGFIDPALNILRLIKENGETIATLVNFGVHVETIKNKEITADFLGYMYEKIEQKFGGMTMFVNGVLGAMVSPAEESGERVHKNDWEAVARYEKRFTKAVLETAQKFTLVKNPKIKLRHKIFKSPLQNPFFRLLAAIGVFPERAPDGYLTTEINFWQIGPAWIITIPGEAYPRLGLDLRKQMQGNPNFIFGLANDELGYIMYSDDCRKSQYRYEKTMAVSCKIGDQLYEELVELIK